MFHSGKNNLFETSIKYLAPSYLISSTGIKWDNLKNCPTTSRRSTPNNLVGKILSSQLLKRRQTTFGSFKRWESTAFLFDQIILNAAYRFGGIEDF
jgi:hypothetical protein